jgi:cytosine/adenosine deaminase-related metal-dependent hydrolase
MTEQIIHIKWLVRGIIDRHTPDIVTDGAVLVRDGFVVDSGELPAMRRLAPLAKVSSYPHHMMLPGFVNAHHHVGLTPLQLGSQDEPLELWWTTRMAARSVNFYLDTLYSAFEMIASGITTVQHIQGWLPGPLENIEQIAARTLDAYRDIGMRASYSFAIRQQNRLVYQDDDAFCASLPRELGRELRDYLSAQEIPFDDNFALFDTLRRSYGDDRIKIQLAPGNLHWVSDDQMTFINAKAAAAGVPLHMHLLETPYQKEYARQRTGTTAVKHLAKLGVLGPHFTMGHGVWLDDDDIEIVRQTGSCICHNCSSNFRLRSGTAPLNRFRAHDIPVGIGLDEAGINDDRDMLQEMRLILRVHRTPGMNDSVPTCSDVVRMATDHGAATTGWGSSIGTLYAGKIFDAVLIDYDQATYPYQDDDIPPLDAIIQRAKPPAVSTVFVGGDIVYENGKFPKVDRDSILATIADQLALPRSQDELRLRNLSHKLVPHIRSFYEGYIRTTQ